MKVSDFNNPGNEVTIRSANNRVSAEVARVLGARAVPAGAILLPKVGAALLGNARRIAGEPSLFDNNVLAIVPFRGDSRYLRYWLTTVDAAQLANPGPVPSLTDSALLDAGVPVEDERKQQAIADYLDTETTRIDALIERKKRMVELLEERRQETTLAAVSGKLTTAGPYSPVGIPWLTEIPSWWSSPLLRLVAVQGTGHTPSRSKPEWWHPDECVTPWVTTGEVAQVRSDRVRVIYETRENVSPAGLANSSAEIHPEGTVFLCRTASAGYSGIMGVAMATSQDFATWTCSDVLRPEFLLLCLRAMRQDLLGRLAVGSTHKTIYMPDIQTLKIPLPSVDEQDVIIEKTNRLLNRSFEAEESLVKQVDLLAEKRQALITAAVTGELEIPGVAV